MMRNETPAGSRKNTGGLFGTSSLISVPRRKTTRQTNGTNKNAAASTSVSLNGDSSVALADTGEPAVQTSTTSARAVLPTMALGVDEAVLQALDGLESPRRSPPKRSSPIQSASSRASRASDKSPTMGNATTKPQNSRSIGSADSNGSRSGRRHHRPLPDDPTPIVIKGHQVDPEQVLRERREQQLTTGLGALRASPVLPKPLAQRAQSPTSAQGQAGSSSNLPVLSPPLMYVPAESPKDFLPSKPDNKRAEASASEVGSGKKRRAVPTGPTHSEQASIEQREREVEELRRQIEQEVQARLEAEKNEMRQKEEERKRELEQEKREESLAFQRETDRRVAEQEQTLRAQMREALERQQKQLRTEAQEELARQLQAAKEAEQLRLVSEQSALVSQLESLQVELKQREGERLAREQQEDEQNRASRVHDKDIGVVNRQAQSTPNSNLANSKKTNLSMDEVAPRAPASVTSNYDIAEEDVGDEPENTAVGVAQMISQAAAVVATPQHSNRTVPNVPNPAPLLRSESSGSDPTRAKKIPARTAKGAGRSVGSVNSAASSARRSVASAVSVVASVASVRSPAADNSIVIVSERASDDVSATLSVVEDRKQSRDKDPSRHRKSKKKVTVRHRSSKKETDEDVERVERSDRSRKHKQQKTRSRSHTQSSRPRRRSDSEKEDRQKIRRRRKSSTRSKRKSRARSESASYNSDNYDSAESNPEQLVADEYGNIEDIDEKQLLEAERRAEEEQQLNLKQNIRILNDASDIIELDGDPVHLLSPRSRMRRIHWYEFQFDILQKNYPEFRYPAVTEETDIVWLEAVYKRILRQIRAQEACGTYKVYLIIGFVAAEVMCSYFFGPYLKDFTRVQLASSARYERLLFELGERNPKAIGGGWSVEVRLMILVLVNAIVYAGINMLKIPDSFKNMLQQRAASFINGKSASESSAPPPPPTASEESTASGLNIGGFDLGQIGTFVNTFIGGGGLGNIMAGLGGGGAANVPPPPSRPIFMDDE